MGETMQREFSPGQVLVGSDPQPDSPSPIVPGMGMPQPSKPPIARPTFLSAFLQNLGPALATGLQGGKDGEHGFGAGLSGALQGIQEQKRYTEEQDFKKQQVQAQQQQTQFEQARQAANDTSQHALAGSEINRNNAEAYKAGMPAPDNSLSELELFHQQNPDAPISDFFKMKAGGATPATPHTVTTDKGIFQYNPKSNAYDIKVGNAPPKESTRAGPGEKATDAYSTKLGTDAASAVQTAQGADFRYRSMASSYPHALKGDQNAMLNIVANHIGMTLGLQKGARITKAIWDEAVTSVPALQHAGAKFDSRGYLSGVVLAPQQMDQMMGLAVSQRANAWQEADDATSQAGVPVAKHPSDLGKENYKGGQQQGGQQPGVPTGYVLRNGPKGYGYYAPTK